MSDRLSFGHATLLIGLGAPRAGSKWLENYFARHGEILVSPLTLHYFDATDRLDRHYVNTLRMAEARLIERMGAAPETPPPAIALLRDRVRMIDDPRAYLDFFKNRRTGEKVFADITSSYHAAGREAFARMRDTHPRVRFLFVMRNPIDRFWSARRWALMREEQARPAEIPHPGPTSPPMDKRAPVPAAAARAPPHTYATTLADLDAVVQSGNVKACFFENLFDMATIAELCGFLGVGVEPADVGAAENASVGAELDTEGRRGLFPGLEPVYRALYERYHGRLPASWLQDMDRFGARGRRSRFDQADLAPAPFTEQLGFSRQEREEISRRLASLGVRALPYPFASATAVLSDCDGSSRPRYQAYLEAFHRLGLDFGDSAWLRWSQDVAEGKAAGLGFFSPTFSKGLDQDEALMVRTRTFFESVAAYHAGDIDHFHALLAEGPRAVIVEREVADADEIEIVAGPFQQGGPWATDNFYLFGLLVEGDCQGAGVVENDGTETAGFQRLAAPLDRQALFALPFDPEGENRAPMFRDLARIKLLRTRGVKRVMLLTCHSQLLLERTRHLRRFNIEMNLITEHSRAHFRNPKAAALDDAASSERLRNQASPLGAFCGVVRDGACVVLSTDADDPASVCRVLPELFDLGLRFLAPRAAEGVDGWDPLDVLSPTPTRAGGAAYWARRTLPLGTGVGYARHETFAARLRGVLDDAAVHPGQVWPIYTHLGAITEADGYASGDHVPQPYFDEDSMRALQDAALGLAGGGPRMWFTRGSTLYDYCLMLRSIGEHVRRDGDTIDIDSWRDPVLAKTAPCSPAQLFGLTFRVKDAGAAVVRLDGRIIDTLARNGPDETGLQSVTILDSETRSILFDQLNPLENYPDESDILGECAWLDGALAVDGAVTIPLHGWSAPAAQAFSFDARGTFGIRLRTLAGGAFYFGDPRWREDGDEATYTFLKGDAGRFVVPLYDLRWRSSSGARLASHPLASITLMGQASFARLAFLRPRATTLRRDGYCLAGRAPDFVPGQVVDLDGRQASVDQRGWFCFPQTPRGIYRLTSRGRCDRRGPMMEVGSDWNNLVLDRRC